MQSIRLVATFGFGLAACVGLSGAIVVVAVDQTDLISTLSASNAVPLLLAGMVALAGFLLFGRHPGGFEK